MKIEFKDFVIRNVIKPDAKYLFLWWNDGSIMAHANFLEGLGIAFENINFQIENMPNSKTKWFMLEKNHIPIGEMNYRLMFLFQNGCKKIVVLPNFCNQKVQYIYECLGFQKQKFIKIVGKTPTVNGNLRLNII